ncbi:MAG TPA: hypothetical protein VIY48_20580 [Candidatus Paceibacterota bacterium]
MTSFVEAAYTVVALIVAGLLVFVMQQAETDRTSKIDHPTLQWLRRLAFTIASLSLLYSVQSIDWQLTCLILVSTSGILLFINAVALSMRAPPTKGTKLSHHAVRLHRHSGFSHAMSRLIHYFSAHR